VTGLKTRFIQASGLDLGMVLGYSPCPNDCLIFYALAHGRVAANLAVQVQLEDVETLNQLARKGTLEVSKVSYHAYFHLTRDYVMLRSGGALGFGVGPLLVSKRPLKTLSGLRVVTPGGLTTANLLLKLSQANDLEVSELRYDRIMPAVAAGEADAGLIIHESRFTFSEYGLVQHLDLGAWWEAETGLPLPLGGIMAKRSLGAARLSGLEAAIRDSLHYGTTHRAEAQPYIARHAQELSESVMQRHIDLYVNDLSLDVGRTGERAVQELYRRAQAQGLVPDTDALLFHG
jgi:1,4-dihydroxy-6-naphthoate synthase